MLKHRSKILILLAIMCTGVLMSGCQKKTPDVIGVADDSQIGTDKDVKMKQEEGKQTVVEEGTVEAIELPTVEEEPSTEVASEPASEPEPEPKPEPKPEPEPDPEPEETEASTEEYDPGHYYDYEYNNGGSFDNK